MLRGIKNRIKKREEEKERQRLAEERRKRREIRENRIKSISERSGMSFEEVKQLTRNARKKYGIKGKTFEKNRLWKYPEDRYEAVVRNHKLERAALRMRKSYRRELMNRVTSSNEVAIPAPIRAAYTALMDAEPATLEDITEVSKLCNCSEQGLTGIRSLLELDIIPETDKLLEAFDSFKERYDTRLAMDYSKSDLAVFFVDYMLYAHDFGYSITDYFDYNFFEKELDERLEFLSEKYKRYIRNVCDKDKSLLMDKGLFNDYYSDYIHRKWIDASKSSREEFIEFCEGHDRLFRKPTEGGYGIDAGIVNLKGFSPEALFEESRDCIFEEIVEQHAEMARFNESSTNTIRVYSLVDVDDKVFIPGAVARFGRKGREVDNFHSDGVGALIDVETGAICSDAKDIYGRQYSAHPDSGIAFKGFAIPHWSEAIELIKEAAIHGKEINRHVGWDIAICKDGSVEIIEGNSRPDFDVLQLDGVGRVSLYEDRIAALAEAAYKPGYHQPLHHVEL